MVVIMVIIEDVVEHIENLNILESNESLNL